MASTQHGVLTANQVTSVTITPDRGGFVVVNRSLEGTIWVTYDGTDPVIGGAGSYVVFAAREFPLNANVVRRGAITVKLLAADANAYSVEAISG